MTSGASGETGRVDVRRRVVDAAYLSPTIPATTRPPFGVADDARVVPINELARSAEVPNRYVIVGAGKTATDGIVWLLANGVPPDRIVAITSQESNSAASSGSDPTGSDWSGSVPTTSTSRVPEAAADDALQPVVGPPPRNSP